MNGELVVTKEAQHVKKFAILVVLVFVDSYFCSDENLWVVLMKCV